MSESLRPHQVLHGELFPTLDVGPDDFRQLARALEAWFAAEHPTGLALGIDAEAVAHLAAGEPPLSPQLRLLALLDAECESEGRPPLTGAERQQAVEEWLGANRPELATMRELVKRPVVVFQCRLILVDVPWPPLPGVKLGPGVKTMPVRDTLEDGRLRDAVEAAQSLRWHVPGRLVGELRFGGVAY